MTNYRTVSIILLFTLALVSSSWVLFFSKHSIKNKNAEDPHRMLAFATAVEAVNYDKTGKIQNELFSPKIVSYSNETTDFTTPHLIVYTTPSWSIDAQHGEVRNATKEIAVWDHVKLHQAASGKNREVTITTQSAIVYVENKYAETFQPVTLVQPGIEINSVGVRAYLKESRVELLSQAKGRYDPHA